MPIRLLLVQHSKQHLPNNPTPNPTTQPTPTPPPPTPPPTHPLVMDLETLSTHASSQVTQNQSLSCFTPTPIDMEDSHGPVVLDINHPPLEHHSHSLPYPFHSLNNGVSYCGPSRMYSHRTHDSYSSLPRTITTTTILNHPCHHHHPRLRQVLVECTFLESMKSYT